MTDETDDQPRPDRPGEPPGEEPTREAPRAEEGPPGPRPRKLFRSREDRVLGGVAGGLGRYFAVDPIVFRIGAVALALFGGAGVFLYLAVLLFVPVEGEEAPPRGRLATIAGAVVLGIAALALIPGAHFFLFGPGALLVLIAGGVAVYLLLRDREGGAARSDVLRVVRVIALAMALVLLAALLFVGSAWATAAGAGAVVAVVVLLLGAGLAVTAARGRPIRWLAVPALVIAVPSGIVAAADVDLTGGFGEREYRPASAAAVAPRYELAGGRMVIDLRNARLPAGPRPLNVDLEMGQAVLVVPKDVCVQTDARVGAGMVGVLGQHQGGFDVAVSDHPPAPPSAPRLDVNADLGMGALLVVNRPPPRGRPGRDFGPGEGGPGPDGFGPRGRRGPGGRHWRQPPLDAGASDACHPAPSTTAQLDPKEDR